MSDRVLAFFAFLLLVAFLGILAWELPRLDLGGVIAITLALAGWDFLSNALKRSGRR
ncbi:hypothetical protein [Alkalilacustris brevis]|uniref:hypothetical protein n=1 Tax=Alkalilacustris brevis TaxID=2026338 RepID=UPI00192E5627|nr:hypothetical protein [Alkalilacustris brevis]